MLQLRRDNPPEVMTDKAILEKVLGRQSNRLHGWGRSPSKSQRTRNEGSSRPTYAQALAELKEMKADYAEARRELEDVKADHASLKGDFLKIRQQLLDENVLSHPSSPRAPSNYSGPSRGGASLIGNHGFLSDSDDIF